MDDVVAILVVDELLNDEIYSVLHVLLGSEVTEFINDLSIVLNEGSLEDSLNLWLFSF